MSTKSQIGHSSSFAMQSFGQYTGIFPLSPKPQCCPMNLNQGLLLSSDGSTLSQLVPSFGPFQKSTFRPDRLLAAINSFL